MPTCGHAVAQCRPLCCAPGLHPSCYAAPPAQLLPGCASLLPAEPLLEATRKVVPPFNGLDVSPIVWVALLSFLAEILTGPQVCNMISARCADSMRGGRMAELAGTYSQT